MPGAYTTPTLADAVAIVASRLQDPNHLRWTVNELILGIQEALRVWNAFTGMARDTGVFNTVAGQPFYDLPTELPGLRGYNITGSQLVNQIEYALLEPPSGTGGWVGTSQFSLDDLTEAVQTKRDDFLLQTASVVTHRQLTIAPPPDGRINLPQDLQTIRRAAWISPEGNVRPLYKTDEWGANAFSPAWPQRPSAAPRSYSLGVTAPLIMQCIPAPSDTGVLDLLTVDVGTPVNPRSATDLLGVPDDWAWVVYYGALGYLLNRDGLALDPIRSSYCEQRWTQGIAACAASAVVLTSRINNITKKPGSITDLDHYKTTWQMTLDRPRTAALMGQNLVALAPVPNVPDDPPSYAITLDLVRNAPVPLSLSTPLQIPPSYLDAIYAYAQHWAIFKDGPGQLQTSMPLLQSFMTEAGVWQQFDQAAVPNRGMLTQQQTQESMVNPRVLVPVDVPGPSVTVNG